MKKFLMAAALVGAAVAAKGTGLCSADLNIAGIQASTGGSCEVGDKIFSNFVYTPGAGDPDAGHVTVQATETDGTQTFGLQFGSNITGGDWVSNFTLSFTITVDQTACQALYPGTASCFISGAQDQFQGGQAGPTNTAALTGVHTGGTISLNALNPSGANETGQITGLNLASMTDSFTAVASATNPISQFGSEVFQGRISNVPEPATLSLMGISLLGFGLMRRRQVKK